VKLSEYHTDTGRSAAGSSNTAVEANSDDFVFDNEMLAQAVSFRFNDRRDKLSTKYFKSVLDQFPQERHVRIRRPLDLVEISAAAMGYHAIVDLRYQGRNWNWSNKAEQLRGKEFSTACSCRARSRRSIRHTL